MRLDHHPDLDARALLPFLAARAVPGVEEVVDGVYRRSLPDGSVLELRPAEEHGGGGAVTRRAARAILRLDADPDAILARLGDDPLLGPSVRAAPGRRIPGHPDPAELAVRALLGQQISVAAARTLAGRLVAAVGEPLERPVGGITHRFPTPEALAALDPETLPMPRARARALVGMAGKPFGTHLPGVGPWTAAYVALRSGDDDAFLAHRPRRRSTGSPRSAEARAEELAVALGHGGWVAAREPAGRGRSPA